MLTFGLNRVPFADSGFALQPRKVVRGATADWYPGNTVLDGNLADDPDNANTNMPWYLRAGMVLGLVTASKKFAPSILGVLQSAYSHTNSLDAHLFVTPAQAVAIARRMAYDLTTTLTLTGPPTASGTSVQQTVTVSSINTITGNITMTGALGADAIAGSLVGGVDGSQNPLTVLDKEDGLVIVTPMFVRYDAGFALLTRGTLLTANIVNYPTNAVLIAWLQGCMSAAAGGKFTFDDSYGA